MSISSSWPLYLGVLTTSAGVVADKYLLPPFPALSLYSYHAGLSMINALCTAFSKTKRAKLNLDRHI